MVDIPTGDYVVEFLDGNDIPIENTNVVLPSMAEALNRVKDTAPQVGALGWRVYRCVARSDDKERW